MATPQRGPLAEQVGQQTPQAANTSLVRGEHYHGEICLPVTAITARRDQNFAAIKYIRDRRHRV